MRAGIALILLVATIAAAQPAAQAADTSLSEPMLVDASGVPMTGHINVNQKFYIAADLYHDGDSPQPFVYIVQIADEDGSTILLKWIAGEMDPEQQLNIAVSWTPTTPGTYTIQTFLWDGIHSQNALDSNRSAAITIS